MSKRKDNRLIAEFMGWKQREHPLGGHYWWRSCDSTDFNKGTWSPCCEEGNEAFNSSWDWLMLVVKKAKAIATEAPHPAYITFAPVMNSFHDLDIKETYKALIVFIKWYNENN